MGDATTRTWDEIVDRLQAAANELRATAGRSHEVSPEEEEAAERLKADVRRLEQSAAALRNKLAGGLETQREEFETAFDRERAKPTTDKLKVALDELVALTRTVSAELKAAAESTFTQAQPEIKIAIRALEDVGSSSATWVRAVIDPTREPQEGRNRTGQPPLDDL